MKIAMIASEALPFVKVGGLADVVYSLSDSLVKKNLDVLVVLPFYSSIRKKIENPKNLQQVYNFQVIMSWRHLDCQVYSYTYHGIKYYFLKNDFYFERDEIYGYQDDFERFAFFALASFKLVNQYLKDIDIIHLHDWQSSPLALLNHHYHLSNHKYVLTIHNPCFQGICQRKDLFEYFNLPESYFDDGLCRLDDNVNMLKSAIMLCDKITTVSPNHRHELLNGIFSYGLEKILPYREKDFIGIFNGIDYSEFDSKNDEYIFKAYNIKNFKSCRKENKIKFFYEIGLDNPNWPTFSIVSRLTKQKGMDLVVKNIETILNEKLNIIVLGKGEKKFEEKLLELSKKFSNLKVLITYSDSLAHKIYASSDFLLMVSLFEPCGISQMIAMKYGCIPIGSKNGGLVDTIIPLTYDNFDEATGFLIDLSDQNFINVIKEAINIYCSSKIISIIKNGMKKDLSWASSSEKYIECYKKLIK